MALNAESRIRDKYARLVGEAHEEDGGHEGAILGAQNLQPRPDRCRRRVLGTAHHPVRIPTQRHHLTPPITTFTFRLGAPCSMMQYAWLSTYNTQKGEVAKCMDVVCKIVPATL